MSVEPQWVKFLVRGLDPKVLARIRRDASRRRLSVSDFMRMILCRHYSMDCPSSGVAFSAKRSREQGMSTTFILRLQPELKDEIVAEAQERKVSQQIVVHEILCARYARKKAA